ncbi:MAG: hypothetical protein ACI8PB_002911 [Desulforhopalus sp.]|jgi:hypothetical protein
MQITVSRAPADNQGADIIDELLTTDQVAVARGRREIDYVSTDRVDESCQCPAHAYIPTGALAGVTEAAGGWRGLVRYWSLTLTVDDAGALFTADTRLSIERELK